MISIADILRPEDILLDLNISGATALFDEVGQLMQRRHGLPRVRVAEALVQREAFGSTALGQGVAIPHGRLKALKDTACAFVRTAAPLPFESPDGQPVRLVLAMLVPEHATEQHLELLSELAQMFSDGDLRDRLLAAADAPSAHALLTRWSAYAAAQRPAAL